MDITTPVRIEPLSLVAADGYRLAATVYRVERPRGQIVVGGATAVPQDFYRRFAHYAAQRGWQTLTVDYRGVARSAPARLRGFRMDYRDWARLDLAAAIEHCDPALPLHLIGHSYGGHAIGLLPNHRRLRSAYVFGAGAGWHGWMPPLERLRVLALWWLIGPPLVRLKGYLPFKLLGMGEDTPIDVFYQWRRWCGFPHYFFDDPRESADMRAKFAEVRVPILLANATDDKWAPPRSRDAFMTGYVNSDCLGVDIDAQRSGLGEIGHMGYFRAKAEPLWRAALERLETPLAAG
jgi:predicted alpha/beta hydrolase